MFYHEYLKKIIIDICHNVCFHHRFQKLFLPIFLLTFKVKVKVKTHVFRIYGTSDHVIVFGSVLLLKEVPNLVTGVYIERR